MFHLDNNYKEITHYFPLQNTFVASLNSLNSQTPSTEGIQVITPAELLVISKENIELMYHEVPATEELGQKIITEMSKRITLLINSSADKRYEAIW